MLGKANTFFTCSKATVKRVSSLVVAVFMLQVVAAGFCVTLVDAEPLNQVSAMAHCSASAMHKSSLDMAAMHMSDADTDVHTVEHACAHCDLPDIGLTLDKHAFSSAADVAADYVVIAIAATTADVAIATFAHSPPDTPVSYNTLNSYNLNLRIRV